LAAVLLLLLLLLLVSQDSRHLHQQRLLAEGCLFLLSR
jgi:hypothetical protein